MNVTVTDVPSRRVFSEAWSPFSALPGATWVLPGLSAASSAPLRGLVDDGTLCVRRVPNRIFMNERMLREYMDFVSEGSR